VRKVSGIAFRQLARCKKHFHNHVISNRALTEAQICCLRAQGFSVWQKQIAIFLSGASAWDFNTRRSGCPHRRGASVDQLGFVIRMSKVIYVSLLGPESRPSSESECSKYM
jgi:hypothetical protein